MTAVATTQGDIQASWHCVSLGDICSKPQYGWTTKAKVEGGELKLLRTTDIDHVVIAPQGVFAVETKGYSKPNRAQGAADARVEYDGKALRFPDWSTNKPIEQAAQQAQWLSRWLASATGEPMAVAPVLALPGWYVDRKGRGDVVVLSGRELRKHLLKSRGAKSMSAEQMQRVVHQVEQRCRDVKASYREDEG